jgi:hypothetical protein
MPIPTLWRCCGTRRSARTPTPALADPWTHTATPANALPYLTIWRSVGGVVFEKYTDCKINSMTIDGQAGAPLQVTLEYRGHHLDVSSRRR